MKYWEFLIQKEGDQTWLPLETQQVEILEGRYRVVAHTDRANTSMEVKVSQLVADEMPPRRRVRKRVSTTNDSGLVVVMPFVTLQPGQWDLACNSLAGAFGESWQYHVQLQVFAHTEEDWSGEWPMPSDDETRSSVSSVILEGDRDVDAALVNQDLPLIQAQAELDANLPDTHKLAEAPSYRVSLKQQAYLAHPQLPMKIVGNVSALSGTAIQETSQLWIRLQNPQTAKVIMEASRPLSLARLPADFKVQIQLPAEVSTRVILGEVSLRTEAAGGSSSGADGGGEVLASTSFTISAGIAELLEAIANQEPDSFSNGFEEEVISMPSLSPVNKAVAPAVGVVLPPKLDAQLDSKLDVLDYSSDSDYGDRNGHAQPALPDFGSPVSGSPVSGSPVSGSLNSGRSADDDQILNDTDFEAADAAFNPDNGDAARADVEPAVDEIPIDTKQSPVSELTASELTASELPISEMPAPNPPVADPLRDPYAAARPAMVAQPAQFLGTSIEDSDIEADEIAAVLEDIDKNLSSDDSDLDALEAPGVEAALPKMPRRENELSHEQAEKLAANEAARESNRRSVPEKSPRQIEAGLDFQALRLKDHFWNKLSNLTHQSHQEASQLADRMKEAGLSREEQPNLLVSPNSRANSEVVIYNEPEPLPPEESSHRSLPQTPVSEQMQAPAAAPSPLVEKLLQSKGLTRPASAAAVPSIPVPAVDVPAADVPAVNLEDLPEMALPVISVPMGDLVAGDIITVTVRTRPSVYKPFIKLWMVDRQSRSLVIEPKLLTNMTPDALGDLETSAQLQIPMHCLDVQIAAIAIDMATQQESAKAIVNRHVVPAEQSLPLKDANI